MKKYSKLIVAAIVALIFVGTFVFLYQKSQPKATEYSEFVPKMGDVLKTTVITGDRTTQRGKRKATDKRYYYRDLQGGWRLCAGWRGDSQGKGDSRYGTA